MSFGKTNLNIDVKGKRPLYKSYLWGAMETFRCEDEMQSDLKTETIKHVELSKDFDFKHVELPKDFDFRSWVEENKNIMIFGISFDKNSKEGYEWQLRTVDLAKYPSLVKERLIYGLTHILANLKKD